MKISKKCVSLPYCSGLLFILQMALESVPHVSLPTVPVPFIIDSMYIHYGALRSVIMDIVVLRVATILSLLYACTCRELHQFMLMKFDICTIGD